MTNHTYMQLCEEVLLETRKTKGLTLQAVKKGVKDKRGEDVPFTQKAVTDSLNKAVEQNLIIKEGTHFRLTPEHRQHLRAELKKKGKGASPAKSKASQSSPKKKKASAAKKAPKPKKTPAKKGASKPKVTKKSAPKKKSKPTTSKKASAAKKTKASPAAKAKAKKASKAKAKQ